MQKAQEGHEGDNSTTRPTPESAIAIPVQLG